MSLVNNDDYAMYIVLFDFFILLAKIVFFCFVYK